MRRRPVLRSILTVVSGIRLAGCSSLRNDPPPTSPSERRKTVSTDVSNRDRDGDGFSVCEESYLLDKAEVGQMDVFVEIDWTDRNRPDSQQIDRLIDVYGSAPIENSHDTESGMNLNITYGQKVPAQEEPFGLDDLRQYKRDYFDNQGRGYHYAIFVEEVTPPAFEREDDGHVIVQSHIPDTQSMSPIQVFAHELGHALGLSGDVFEGIDSGRRRFNEYPSIMNYRGMEQDGHLDFSDGTNSEADFDDWDYLRDELHVPDTSDLKTDDIC